MSINHGGSIGSWPIGSAVIGASRPTFALQASFSASGSTSAVGKISARFSGKYAASSYSIALYYGTALSSANAYSIGQSNCLAYGKTVKSGRFAATSQSTANAYLTYKIKIKGSASGYSSAIGQLSIIFRGHYTSSGSSNATAVINAKTTAHGLSSGNSIVSGKIRFFRSNVFSGAIGSNTIASAPIGSSIQAANYINTRRVLAKTSIRSATVATTISQSKNNTQIIAGRSNTSVSPLSSIN